jgi:putative ATP-dependent endonuclease of OLD family
VILVEGDAEEILVPLLVKRILGLSVDELGISVINIRSTGFMNVAVLFHDIRIRKRCAIVTDLDEIFFDTTPDPSDSDALASRKRKAVGSQAAGATRRTKLDAFITGNAWVRNFYATHTFEVDLVSAGNHEAFVNCVTKVYTSAATIAQATTELRSGNIWQSGYRTLTMAEKEGKGWFAILLAQALDHQAVMPEYIREAVMFAHGPLSRPLIMRIVRYRMSHVWEKDEAARPRLKDFNSMVDLFGRSEIDLATLRVAAELALPGDVVHAFLAEMT